MSRLTEALDRIETWLIERYPRIGLHLEEGLNREEIDDIMKNYSFSLPEELYEFYGWHNGSTDASDVIPPFDHFPSLQEILEQYRDDVTIWIDSWHENWLTILNLNGDVLCTIVLGEKTAPIWYIDRECGVEEIVWNSFTDLALATAECFEQGAYYLDEVDEYGYLVENNSKQMKTIFKKYNYRGSADTTSLLYGCNEEYYQQEVDNSKIKNNNVNQKQNTTENIEQTNTSDLENFDKLVEQLYLPNINPSLELPQQIAINVLEAIANFKLSEQIGMLPLIRRLQNKIYQGIGDFLQADQSGQLDDSIFAFLVESYRILQKSSYAREEVIDSLVKLNDDRVIQPLIQCLFDADYCVSLKAARELGNLGNPKAIKPLIHLLARGNSYPVIYSAVIQSLGKLKAVEAIEPINKFWEEQAKSFKKHDYDDLTLSKFKAFAQIEDEKTTKAMAKFLLDRNHILNYSSSSGFVSCSYRIMEIIIPVLWERKYPDLKAILSQLLQDANQQIRSYTLNAITQIDDETIGDLLTLVFLSDEQMRIRSSATTALASRKDARAIEPLIKILKEGDNYTRLREFETLHHLEISHNQQVVETVIHLLQDENVNIRCGAALFLGEIKEQKAIAPLSKCLKDPSPMVRKVVKKVLSQF